jgi:negative regulator of genetic competence, sporulation and motility
MAKKELDKFKDRYFLEGRISSFKDKMAVIVTKDKQELLWPIKDLPEECEKGTKVRIILSTAKSDQEEREKAAKTILNEILKKSNKKNA